MKIIVTGTRGLAKGLQSLPHDVICLGREFDISRVVEWAGSFADADCLINCAYHEFDQVAVLEAFANVWRKDKTKIIINVGSAVSDYSRSETLKDSEYWPYRIHKQALQSSFNRLTKECMCAIKLINPGAIDTDMVQHLTVPKMTVEQVSQYINQLITDPVIKRIDLWQ